MYQPQMIHSLVRYGLGDTRTCPGLRALALSLKPSIAVIDGFVNSPTTLKQFLVVKT